MPGDPIERRLESLEEITRQLAVGQARAEERGASFKAILEKVEQAAGEARDGVNRVSNTLAEQNLGARIEKLDTSFRSDLQNAVARARTEIKTLSDRLEVLEDAEARREGGNQLVKLLREWAAPLIALLALIVSIATRLGAQNP